MPGRRQGLFKFEDFTLDLDTAELRKAGLLVHIEPQVFDLIALMASNTGQVISRDDIIEHIWNGRIVSDSAISTRINAARKALDDDGTLQRVIKTVHGRGFRFAADTEKLTGKDHAVTSNPVPVMEPGTVLSDPGRPSIICSNSDLI